jgi:hypothetical protein
MITIEKVREARKLVERNGVMIAGFSSARVWEESDENCKFCAVGALMFVYGCKDLNSQLFVDIMKELKGLLNVDTSIKIYVVNDQIGYATIFDELEEKCTS